MPDNIGLFTQGQEELKRAQAAKAEAPSPEGAPEPVQEFSDEELLELWQHVKKESFDSRNVFERQWMRNLYYVLNRQWIEYFPREGRWKDKRLAAGIPRPVTNECKTTVQTIRAMFSSIKLGANVRPLGSDPANVSAAATADELQPALYEAHDMDHVLHEFDFWLVALGNAFMHTFVDFDIKHGVDILTAEQCKTCGMIYQSAQLAETNGACPDCGGTEFQDATDPKTGAPMQEIKPKGRPQTVALSPLELAFPNTYGRFSDVPFVVRLRWRSKDYYMAHPTLKDVMKDQKWAKSASDQSLQLYKSLANHNDLGVAGTYYDGISGESAEEGLPEYEVWVKPTATYPQGLVFRVAGDSSPMIIRLEESEGLPGPLPYKEANGNPLFTFTHAGYDHVGGRVWASGALDNIIHKQDQLNQLDSMILLIIQRMSNPVWLEPKGAEVERLTGMPGLVVKWNPLTVGGNAKPERIAGEGPHPSLLQIREQYLMDIERLTGTYDILKGAKPAGVEAFSAMQLLVERSQARFASVFSARGSAFKDQLKFALELEREFGPEERTLAILSPARRWSFKNFQKAQLNGSFSVLVEDGTAQPKTSLGMRASIDHAATLKMLNLQDPDQQYEALKLFGLNKMVPTLDINIQSALQKQQAFEEWVANPEAVKMSLQLGMQATQKFVADTEAAGGPETMLQKPPSPLKFTPLAWRKWYNAAIHRQEFLKWTNGDRIRDLVNDPQRGEHIVQLLEAHLLEIEQAYLEQMQMAMVASGQAPPPQAGGNGSGQGMKNSTRESTTGNEPGGPGRAEAT